MVSNKNSYFIIACRAFHAYMCNGIIYHGIVSWPYSMLSAWLHS